MFSAKLIQSGLEDLKKITKADFCLIDPDGLYIANTFGEFFIDDNLRLFIMGDAASQEVKGYNYMRIRKNDSEVYILVTYAGTGDGYMISRIADSEIRHLMDVDATGKDKEDFFHELFTGHMTISELTQRAGRLKIAVEKARTVYIVETDEELLETCREIFLNLFSEDSEDYATIIDGKVILIKAFAEDATVPGCDEIAVEILSTINTELMAVATVSYGKIKSELRDLYEAYKEAEIALEVSGIFSDKKNIVSYKNLGIGRIIHGLSNEVCRMFLEEVFGNDVMCEPDAEETLVAESFFAHNMSIADTSRDLGIPRSTLVYRIERLKKKCGLDIRDFDDAVTVKIALMVLKYLRDKK